MSSTSVTPEVPVALELRGVGLAIGGARILEDVSFSVVRGEMVGVIGPNGAGKTTLFNLISGVLKPTEGEILLDGASLNSQSVSQRARAGLGRTFQTSSLFPGLSIRENVRLAAQAKIGGSLSILKFPRRADAANQRADECMAQVGLSKKSELRAGDLSHGDKRKVEIAMLLATDPSVILLDEPMAGVGSGDVGSLQEIIRQLNRDSGRTIMMVEHHIDVVLGLADRVAVMHHGKLLAIDEPDAIMANATVQSAYLGEAV